MKDYDLVSIIFGKIPAKITLKSFVSKNQKFICHQYRRYTTAYFEQILITRRIEPRTSKNFRQRFITSNEDIFLVLKMYSEKDYLDYFLNADVDEMNHKQLIELFMTCIQADSFKIALQIYLRYLSQSDMKVPVMNKIINSLRYSLLYHEEKLFFIF